MKVSDWLLAHPALPVTVDPDADIGRVAERFLAYPCLRDIYIATTDGRLRGCIRHRRLTRIILAEHLPIQTSHEIMERVSGGAARDLMDRDFVSAHPDEEIDNVLHRMLEYEVEDMPVFDSEHRIIGNINLTEVMRAALNGDL